MDQGASQTARHLSHRDEASHPPLSPLLCEEFGRCSNGNTRFASATTRLASNSEASLGTSHQAVARFRVARLFLSWRHLPGCQELIPWSLARSAPRGENGCGYLGGRYWFPGGERKGGSACSRARHQSRTRTRAPRPAFALHFGWPRRQAPGVSAWVRVCVASPISQLLPPRG